MNTAAIYARVSTQEQTEGTSLSTQVDRCRAWAEREGGVSARCGVSEPASLAIFSYGSEHPHIEENGSEVLRFFRMALLGN